MSIILGALGGAGQAMQEVGAANQKAQIAQDQATLESNLAQQRAEALEQFKTTLTVNTANQQREAMAGRINAAAGNIADQANAKKLGVIQQGITDPSSWTQEQQAAVDQSLALDKQHMVSDPRTLAQAAATTGDYGTAQELTKIADAGKVTAGWGGVVVDQNDLDENGNPRVIIDNSGGRLEIGQGANDARMAQARARQTAADAAVARANAVADAISSKDPVLSSLGKTADSARIELDRLRGIAAANPPRPGQPDPYAPLIEHAQAAYEAATQRVLDRQNAHLSNPSASPGAGHGNGLIDNGSPAEVAKSQIEIMQSELNRPDLSDEDKAGVQREIDRLKKIASTPTPTPAPVVNPTPVVPPRPAASSASAPRPPLSAFLK